MIDLFWTSLEFPIFIFLSDVIWVILSVEAGGLLGVTQQLSSFDTEFNTQPHRNVSGDYNPFASPQKNRSPEGENMGTWPETETPEKEQNGLSQTSVNICATDRPASHSVATYREVRCCSVPLDQREFKGSPV